MLRSKTPVHLGVWALSLAISCSYSGFALAQENLPPAIPQPPSSDAEVLDADTETDEFSVLMRGPLHEAYAEQYSSDPEAGVVVAKRPPDLIQELPPSYKPDLKDITWIPGYWGFDPELQDFIWVSGIWRQVPPDQQWVPGYWMDIDRGYQWISGFWLSSGAEEIAYLPSPPPSIENGPSSAAPDQDHFWIPGCWVYEQTDYYWQAGYWAPSNENWVWVPTRYVWTPSGCVYRAGYWDYNIADRGTIFCPVRFTNPVATYQYRPTYVIDTNPAWYANLFVYPQYNHYLYGNYYGYSGQNNIYPWGNYYQTTRRFDPLYSYYSNQGRSTGLIQQIVRLQRYFQANQNLRPANTYAAGRTQYAGFNAQQQSVALRAATIASLANRKADFGLPFALQGIQQTAASQLAQSVAPVRQFASTRRDLERAGSEADRLRATVQTDESLRERSNDVASKIDTKHLRFNANSSATSNAIATGLRAESSDDAAKRKAAKAERAESARNDNATGREPNAKRNSAQSLLDAANSNGLSSNRGSDLNRGNEESPQRLSREEISQRRNEIRQKQTDALNSATQPTKPDAIAPNASANDKAPPTANDLDELRSRLGGRGSNNPKAANQKPDGSPADRNGSDRPNLPSRQNAPAQNAPGLNLPGAPANPSQDRDRGANRNAAPNPNGVKPDTSAKGNGNGATPPSAGNDAKKPPAANSPAAASNPLESAGKAAAKLNQGANQAVREQAKNLTPPAAADRKAAPSPAPAPAAQKKALPTPSPEPAPTPAPAPKAEKKAAPAPAPAPAAGKAEGKGGKGKNK